MKKRVLFSHAYYLRLDPKQWATKQPYPPLGTLYAAALAREHGFDIALHDSMFAHSAAELKEAILHFQPDYLVICDDGFNYLTKMCLTNMREAAFQMMAIAKEQHCTVIVSSSDATDHFETYLNKGADFVIIGEPEYCLAELLLQNKKESDYLQVKGLALKTNNGVLKTPARPVSKNLDALPLPAWDLIDLAPYKKMWLESAGYFSLNIATTRGCPYKCNWCAKPIYGNRYNTRSPENVLTEIRLLKEKFGIDHIWFCDDIFGLQPGWVEHFAKLVQDSAMQFRFKIQARADLLAKEKYVQSLAAAGCDNVWMGAESGSQKILDAMDKGITVTQIETATSLLKKYSIKASFFLQFGYPGETRKDISQTIRMVNRLLPHSIGISVSYPLPGTVFFERVKSDLAMKTNWSDSNELELMFRNTYQPDFYRQLHLYVHITHRLHLALRHSRSLFQFPLAIGNKAWKKAASVLYYFPKLLVARYKLEKLAKTSPL